MAKFCTKCNEKMSEGEIVCKYCGSFLTTVDNQPAADGKANGSRAGSFWFLLIAVLIIIGIIIFFSR